MKLGSAQKNGSRLTYVLSSGWFSSVCILTLTLICGLVGQNVHLTIEQLERNKKVFDSQNVRGAYVAFLDVQRILKKVQEALAYGELTDEWQRELNAANDMLFVRVENFYTVQEQGLSLPASDAAVKSLRHVVDVVDAAAAEGFPDLEKTWESLLLLTEQSRQDMMAHIDAIHRFESKLLSEQLEAVKRKRNTIWATLGGLMLFASSALLLLRREIAASVARRHAEARIAHLAFHDSLTGLGNRLSFQEQLGVWLDQDQPATLMFLDIDGFKTINDTHGHAAGDIVLQHVAQILREIADNHHGFASRLGGDEFALTLSVTDMRKVGDICEQILADVSKCLVFEGEDIISHTSIGVATTVQIAGAVELGVDSLSRAADFALYAAKSAGRRCFKIYDEVLEAKYLARRNMVEELPDAIANGEMEVFLQPKVRMATSETYGFEALVRWRRNDLLVPPKDFVSTAEESGQIIELDRSVLRQASQIIADFNKSHGTQFSISVNFSALQFNSTRCCTVIKDVLAETGLPPELLTIELTETTELTNWDRATGIIRAIQSLGVRIAIDDFGAGFSSLAYLRTTFANEIKIDRSLIVNLETSERSRFLLDSVIDIAHNLDLEVTVEGVETQRQLQIVLPMEPLNGQGYFWSKPLPAQEALQNAVQSPVQIQVSGG